MSIQKPIIIRIKSQILQYDKELLTLDELLQELMETIYREVNP